MAIQEFKKVQSTPDTKPRSPLQRITEGIGVWLIEGFLFILFLIGITIKEALLLGLYIGFIVGLGFIWWKVKTVKELQIKLFQRNKIFVYSGVIIAAFVYPFCCLSNPYLIHIGAMAGIYAIMALGLNISLGFARLIDLGYVAFYAIGAYTSALLSVHIQWPFWITLPIAGIIASFFGLLIGTPALRVRGHYLALVTLGFGQIIYLLAINFEQLTGGTNGITRIPAPAIGNFSFSSPIMIGASTFPFQINYYYLILVLVGLGFFATARLNDSRFGRAWGAIREDEVAAKCSSVNITKYKLLAFSAGAFFGGIAGSLYAHMIGFIDPENFTFFLSVMILCMVIMGGMGNVMGVVAGAIILTVAPEKLREFEDLRMLLFGVVLLLLMLYRPQGIFPSYRPVRKSTVKLRTM